MSFGEPDQASSRDDDCALFYGLELFEGHELIAVHFFESHELVDARRAADEAVRNGVADRAELRDDQSRLIFDRGARRH